MAQDKAFSFYYQDSLDLLEAWGAEIVLFSPMEDASLPEGAGGVYLGGGFPEMFAAELSANRPMLESIRQAAQRGIPIYGECGGLMYLGRSLTGFDEVAYPMAGLVPAVSAMSQSRLSLGYREVEARVDGPLLSAGQQVRGHEFHWSTLEQPPAGRTNRSTAWSTRADAPTASAPAASGLPTSTSTWAARRAWRPGSWRPAPPTALSDQDIPSAYNSSLSLEGEG